MARYIVKNGKRVPREPDQVGQGNAQAKAKTAGKGGKTDKPGTEKKGN